MPASSRFAAALAALVAPALALAASTAPAALTVSAKPQMLRLAEGGRALVRVASPSAPVVAVSAGRVEGLREVASGVYQIEYLPPDTLDPQVVIVSAWADGQFGWTTVKLAGVREVEVRAPHRTLVSVSVADEEFGPIPADGTGRAVLRVDVPPGTTFATTKGKRIDLPVPSRGYSHVALERTSVEASAEGSLKARVIALDESGDPLRRAQLRLSGSEGTVSTPLEVAPGVYEAQWSMAPGRVRDARLSADVRTKPASKAVAVLRRIAGEPTAIQVDVDRPRLVAGEGDELVVTSRVVDAGGNPTDAPTRLVVSLGSGDGGRLLPDAVIDWQQHANVYTGRVQVPRQRAGRQQLELKVVAAGGLVGTRTVELLPGPAASVTVESEEELYADGHKRELRVVLLDKFGNRTDAGGKAVVTAVRGIVGTPLQSASGVYVVPYRPPLSATDYDDVIRARVGPLEGQTELRVRARGGTVVLGVKGGYATGSGDLSSPSGGVELGFWRPSFSTSLGLVLDLRYFTFGKDETLSAGAITLPVQSDATFIAFEPSLAWRRPLLRGMFWLGGGPGLMRVSTTVAAPGQADLTATSWDLTAHGSVGWGLPIGAGVPFVELKALWKGETDVGAMRGAVKLFSVNLGYRFDVL